MLTRGRIQLIIVAAALMLFVPGLGAVHLFDWDEINFAEIAREMIVSGDWSRPQIDFAPFHEKPPLFMWMQAASMTVFGVGEFAARLPNAFCGVFTLLLLFRIGARERSPLFGLLWATAYVGSILPHLYFHSGIIDPWFNLFIFLGLYAFIRSARDESWKAALCSGGVLGLAVMTKGPAAILIFGLCVFVYWASRRFRTFFRWAHVAVLVITFLVVVSLWFGLDYLQNGPDFTLAFFQRQVALFTEEDAGHGGFFGYHFVVLLVGCFPASLFALQELLKPTREEGDRRELRRWMVILFWVVLLLFSIVNTKIVHYSSLCYYPLTFLAALQLERIWSRHEGFGWTRFALGIVGSLFAIIVIALPFVAMNIEDFKHLFADPFAQANLEADVRWTGVEAIAGLALLTALISAHFLHQRARYRSAIVASFGGVVLFVWCALFFFIGRVEAYTQRAAVEFFSAKKGERCWLVTFGYKSYVPEFYGEVSEHAPGTEELLQGDIDRPVHLACKNTSVEEVASFDTLTEVGRKNGFVFYVRQP